MLKKHATICLYFVMLSCKMNASGEPIVFSSKKNNNYFRLLEYRALRNPIQCSSQESFKQRGSAQCSLQAHRALRNPIQCSLQECFTQRDSAQRSLQAHRALRNSAQAFLNKYSEQKWQNDQAVRYYKVNSGW